MQRDEMNSEPQQGGDAERARRPDLKDPRLVLSLLEADQVVAAKAQSRFGRTPLSRGMRAALWALRVYVLVMLGIVAVYVFQVLHAH